VVDWGSFWTGVAVAVVAGLILALILRGPVWYRARRRRQAEAAQTAYIWRTPIRVSGQEVARELRENADVAQRCETGSPVRAEARHIGVVKWMDREHELSPLRSEDPALWQELQATYDALRLTRTQGAGPPSSTHLLELAERLDRAAEG
jgi:hypothetical protein